MTNQHSKIFYAKQLRSIADQSALLVFLLTLGAGYWLSQVEKIAYWPVFLFALLLALAVRQTVLRRSLLTALQAKIETVEANCESRYRHYLQNAGENILIVDQHDQIIFANKELKGLFGIDEALLQHMQLKELLQCTDEVFLKHIRQQTTEHGIAVGQLECELKGKVVPFDVTVKALDDGEFYFSLHDLTSVRQQQHELLEAFNIAEQANKARDQFMATISHEVRTPLNGIMGILQILKLEKLSKRALDLVDNAFAASRILLDLLTDTLDFANLEAGRLNLLDEPVDLQRMLQRLSEEFAERAEQLSLKFSYHLSGDLPPLVRCDSMRLNQILNNLLSNALKFTDEGEVGLSVDVHTGLNNSKITFIVKDTGRGINRHYQEQLFDYFSQQDGSQTRDRSGSGLGLAITQRLVRKMGGELQVSSELGSGSEFAFSLILPTAEMGNLPSGVDEIQQTDEILPFAGKRVLVVDDNQLNLIVLEEFLRPMGFEVVTVEDGDQAVAAALADDSRPYHVILMDLQMPKMDGFKAMQLIRQGLPRQTINIIAVSADVSGMTREKAVNAGFDAFLPKPVTIHSLLDTFDKVM